MKQLFFCHPGFSNTSLGTRENEPNDMIALALELFEGLPDAHYGQLEMRGDGSVYDGRALPFQKRTDFEHRKKERRRIIEWITDFHKYL